MLRLLLAGIAVYFLNSIPLTAQQKLVFQKDLSSQWMVFNAEKNTFMKAADAGKFSTVYFDLNPGEYSGGTLLVASHRPFFLLIDGKFIRESEGPVKISIDSLAKNFGFRQMTIAIHQDEINSKELKTHLLVREVAAGTSVELKPPSYFRDFVILSGLLLIIFFAVILRLQPKLAAEYFSPAKILTLRETEDNQGHARLALSSNLWYYVFCSLLVAQLLLILYRFLPSDFLFAGDLYANTFGGVFMKWIWLSFIILVALTVKVLVIFVLSNLFGMRGIAGLHFFNVIRLLLIAGGLLTLIVFLYFIWRGQDAGVYSTILIIFIALSCGWVLMIFLKLSSRSEHSMFHLFSYICATEVIPLLITVKVLFQ